MAGREVAYGGGGGTLNHTKKLKICSHDQPLDSLFASAPSNSLLGSGAMVSFGAVGGVKGSANSFYQMFDPQEYGDEYSDDYLNQQGKKKRLSADQVRFLERSFEAENKLEPERKTQLANELGLQPRQIAVWFQNRRARWKTKQLETEYETLHCSYKSLKTDYDYLLKENERLKAEVFHLKDSGLTEDTESTNSLIRDTKEVSQAMLREAVADVISIDEGSKVSALAKSDITNADSPRLTDGIRHSSGDSSHVFEPDQNDLLRNGENSLNEESLHCAYIFPKIEDAYCHPHLNSFGYTFAVEDHAFSFWSH